MTFALTNASSFTYFEILLDFYNCNVGSVIRIISHSNFLFQIRLLELSKSSVWDHDFWLKPAVSLISFWFLKETLLDFYPCNMILVLNLPLDFPGKEKYFVRIFRIANRLSLCSDFRSCTIHCISNIVNSHRNT